MKAFAEHFGGKMKDWEVDFFGGSHCSAYFAFSYEAEEMTDEERREFITGKLAELGEFNPDTLKGLGSCALTGYCADDDAIDGARQYFAKHPDATLEDIMQAAFSAWLEAAQADCAARFEDEAMAEHCEANGYTFEESGEMNNG